MLIIGHQHEITFKVQVMGTSAEPTARLCLETTPELCFPARNLGDHWSASATIPSDFQPGSYRLRVEVMVNNRHFVPVAKSVDLVYQDQPVGVPVEPHPDVPMPEPVVHAPVPVVELPVEFPAEEPVKEAEASLPAPVEEKITLAPPPAPVKKERQPLNIFQMVADKEPTPVRPIRLPVVESKTTVEVNKPEMPKVSALDLVKAAPKADLGALQKVAESKSVKKFAPIVTPLPKPGTTKPVEVKVKLGDITKIAEKKEPKPVKKTAPRKTQPVLEMKTGSHVKLIKDKIIYE